MPYTDRLGRVGFKDKSGRFVSPPEGEQATNVLRKEPDNVLAKRRSKSSPNEGQMDDTVPYGRRSRRADDD